MPTLVYLDGFEYQVLSVNDFGGTDGEGIFDTLTGSPTINTTVQRTGTACLEVAPSGAIVRADKIIRGANPTRSVVSVYVRFTTLSNSDTEIFSLPTAAATTGILYFRSASGKFNSSIGALDTTKDVGPVLVTGTWYRIDLRLDVAQNPWTLDIAVDGGTSVQDTAAIAASTISSWQFGPITGTPTYTAQFDDFVASNTNPDFPIGAHKVLSVVPESDDTGLSTYGTNIMEQGTGVDLTSGNQGWQYLDEWPPTTGTNNADTVTQAAVGATNDVVSNFQDTAETTIWAAVAVAGLQSDGGAANDGSTTIVNAGGSTVATVYAGDMSENVAHYRTALVATNPTQADFNAYRSRVGLSSDATPDPEWLAIMLQYAVPEAPAVPASLATPPPQRRFQALIVR